jgi:hypothetical protein
LDISVIMNKLFTKRYGEFMGKEMKIVAALLMLIAAGICCGEAYATPAMAQKEKAPCVLCHVNPAGGKELSDVGRTYQAKKELPTDAAQVPEDRQAKYIGDSDCVACHTEEYGSWAKTKHAAAFKPLVEKKAEKNASCLVCHTTGVGLPGGYVDGAEALKNITCEACHGPGSLHTNMPTKQDINTTPSEMLCKSCHIARFSPNFEYTEWVKKGVHNLPGKKPPIEPEEKLQR